MRLPSILMATSLALLGSSSAQETQANTTAPVVVAGAANESAPPGVSVQNIVPIFGTCVQPGGVVSQWWYNFWGSGPHVCFPNDEGEWPWTMLNAFQWGGKQNVHWKYTDNVNDPACLYNFRIFSADGQTHVATASGRTTTYGMNRRWCALPVYRPGGLYGKQWTNCNCKSVEDGWGNHVGPITTPP